MLANSMIVLVVWAVSSVVGSLIVGRVCALNDHPDRPFVASSFGDPTDAAEPR